MLEGLLGILAFFGTILALLIGAILLLVALATRHAGRAWKVARFLLGWLAVYTLLLLGFSVFSQTHYLNPGQERCFDEMCYSVKTLSVAHTLGTAPHQLTAKGNFYILTVQLRSNAKRTAQIPSQPDLFIMDAAGKSYRVALNAGGELNLPVGEVVTASQLWSQPVEPGEIASRTVAFDLPQDVSKPGLVINEGIGPLSAIIIGDENSFLHAKTEIPLNP